MSFSARRENQHLVAVVLPDRRLATRDFRWLLRRVFGREEPSDELGLGVHAEVAVNVPCVACDGVRGDVQVGGDGFAVEEIQDALPFPESQSAPPSILKKRLSEAAGERSSRRLAAPSSSPESVEPVIQVSGTGSKELSPTL